MVDTTKFSVAMTFTFIISYPFLETLVYHLLVHPITFKTSDALINHSKWKHCIIQNYFLFTEICKQQKLKTPQGCPIKFKVFKIIFIVGMSTEWLLSPNKHHQQNKLNHWWLIQCKYEISLSRSSWVLSLARSMFSKDEK